MSKAFIKYLGIYMGIYLVLAAIEIFILKPLVDFLGTNFWIHMCVYSVLFIVVNPVICKLIGNMISKETKVIEEIIDNKESD